MHKQWGYPNSTITQRYSRVNDQSMSTQNRRAKQFRDRPNHATHGDSNQWQAIPFPCAPPESTASTSRVGLKTKCPSAAPTTTAAMRYACGENNTVMQQLTSVNMGPHIVRHKDKHEEEREKDLRGVQHGTAAAHAEWEWCAR